MYFCDVHAVSSSAVTTSIGLSPSAKMSSLISSTLSSHSFPRLQQDVAINTSVTLFPRKHSMQKQKPEVKRGLPLRTQTLTHTCKFNGINEGLVLGHFRLVLPDSVDEVVVDSDQVNVRSRQRRVQVIPVSLRERKNPHLISAIFDLHYHS